MSGLYPKETLMGHVLGTGLTTEPVEQCWLLKRYDLPQEQSGTCRVSGIVAACTVPSLHRFPEGKHCMRRRMSLAMSQDSQDSIAQVNSLGLYLFPLVSSSPFRVDVRAFRNVTMCPECYRAAASNRPCCAASDNLRLPK